MATFPSICYANSVKFNYITLTLLKSHKPINKTKQSNQYNLSEPLALEKKQERVRWKG